MIIHSNVKFTKYEKLNFFVIYNFIITNQELG